MPWSDWVRWCHADQSQSDIDATVLTLIDLSDRSKYRIPIISAHVEEQGHVAAGYVVLYPGALGSLGKLRFCAQRDSGNTPSVERVERELLTSVIRTLCDAALEQGAELVQAISQLNADSVTDWSCVSFAELDSARDLALASAGMNPVAKLIQMERDEIRRPLASPTIQNGKLGFKQHDEISTRDWHAIIEATYIETLDVPELNGLRNIGNTLEGYASTQPRMTQPIIPGTWWVIQDGCVNIGCLLLTPNDDQHCELTYLGLAPSSRGLGHSRAIMDHLDRWVTSHGFERMTLAVDIRNTPAIRLYQSRGFVAERFVQAWIRVAEPKNKITLSTRDL
ncbi:MAG: GNAT family N-acetyltransferase [Planctomycetota bacterium]|nr:GNAT family N-acetyltransferase [Planctomycetota bacterium]